MPIEATPSGVRMEVDGVPFDHFLSFEVSRDIEDFSGSFNCTTSNVDIKNYPINVGSPIKILVNDIPIITGYVDSISPNLSVSDHKVVIQGRDITCDIIDSTLAADSVELSTPTTIADIINKTQAAMGLSIPVIDNSGSTPFGNDDLIACQAGETGFDFIDKNARKRQVFVTTNGNGEIVVTRANPDDTGLKFLDELNGLNNNILESSAKFDNSKRFGKYIALSQSNLTALNDTTDADLQDAVYVKSKPEVDDEIRQSRVLYFIAENPSDGENLSDRAKWEGNIRKARSLDYRATIEGIVNPITGKPYELNGLAYVKDDELSFNTMLLIKGITLKYDLSQGSETEFNMTYANAYTLEINDPARDRKTKEVGSLYTKKQIQEQQKIIQDQLEKERDSQ